MTKCQKKRKEDLRLAVCLLLEQLEFLRTGDAREGNAPHPPSHTLLLSKIFLRIKKNLTPSCWAKYFEDKKPEKKPHETNLTPSSWENLLKKKTLEKNLTPSSWEKSFEEKEKLRKISHLPPEQNLLKKEKLMRKILHPPPEQNILKKETQRKNLMRKILHPPPEQNLFKKEKLMRKVSHPPPEQNVLEKKTLEKNLIPFSWGKNHLTNRSFKNKYPEKTSWEKSHTNRSKIFRQNSPDKTYYSVSKISVMLAYWVRYVFAILLIKTSLYYVENIFVQYTSVLACIAFLTVFVFVPTTHPGILLDFRVPASPQLNPQTLTKVLLRVAQLLYPLVQSLYQEVFKGFLRYSPPWFSLRFPLRGVWPEACCCSSPPSHPSSSPSPAQTKKWEKLQFWSWRSWSWSSWKRANQHLLEASSSPVLHLLSFLSSSGSCHHA